MVEAAVPGLHSFPQSIGRRPETSDGDVGVACKVEDNGRILGVQVDPGSGLERPVYHAAAVDLENPTARISAGHRVSDERRIKTARASQRHRLGDSQDRRADHELVACLRHRTRPDRPHQDHRSRKQLEHVAGPGQDIWLAAGEHRQSAISRTLHTAGNGSVKHVDALGAGHGRETPNRCGMVSPEHANQGARWRSRQEVARRRQDCLQIGIGRDGDQDHRASIRDGRNVFAPDRAGTNQISGRRVRPRVDAKRYTGA